MHGDTIIEMSFIVALSIKVTQLSLLHHILTAQASLQNI
jgi:hypothetical protein